MKAKYKLGLLTILVIYLHYGLVMGCNVGYYEENGACYKWADEWKSWQSSDPNSCIGMGILSSHLNLKNSEFYALRKIELYKLYQLVLNMYHLR